MLLKRSHMVLICPDATISSFQLSMPLAADEWLVNSQTCTVSPSPALRSRTSSESPTELLSSRQHCADISVLVC